MTNVLKNRLSIDIEWTVKMTYYSTTYVSEAFSLQSRKCHLEFVCYTDSNYISYLYLKSNKELKSPVKVTVCISNADGTLNEQSSQTITSANTTIWSHSSLLSNYLMTFKIIIHDGASKHDKSVQISPYTDAYFSLKNLSCDLSKLLDEGPNHDVEFAVGDQTIKAHKNILCSRSNVFASMLQSDMVEGKTGRVNIQDMDATIFHQFLRWLYTGMPPELTVDSAFQFYKASDKYGAYAVRTQCATFLADNLSTENVCDILVLSDQHSDTDFKNSVMEYIIKEKIPCMGQKWKDFCKENPTLALEVYSLFCEHICPN